MESLIEELKRQCEQEKAAKDDTQKNLEVVYRVEIESLQEQLRAEKARNEKLGDDLAKSFVEIKEQESKITSQNEMLVEFAELRQGLDAKDE